MLCECNRVPPPPEDIDFVITWVDGSDPEWQASYRLYLAKIAYKNPLLREKVAGERRYRELGTLKYLFRGIEMHAPWVRKIHLITCGHFPAWLDTNHPKINLLTHRDIFRDPSDLPTFNSHAIHANLGGIKGLAEYFVLFDDDTLIIRDVPPSRFFERGLPKDYIQYTALRQWGDDPWWLNSAYQGMLKLHKHFRLNPLKVLMLPLVHSGYGRDLNRSNLRNFRWSFFKRKRICFSPLSIYHQPLPLLKQSLFAALSAFEKDFIETSRHRFRHPKDIIASYTYRYWHLLEHKFIPFFSENESWNIRISNYKNLNMQFNKMFTPNVRFLCLNDDIPDSASSDEESLMKELVTKRMERLFPQKSSFEI